MRYVRALFFYMLFATAARGAVSAAIATAFTLYLSHDDSDHCRRKSYAHRRKHGYFRSAHAPTSPLPRRFPLKRSFPLL